MKFSAKHPLLLFKVDLEFDSLKEAQRCNPTLIDWEVKER